MKSFNVISTSVLCMSAGLLSFSGSSFAIDEATQTLIGKGEYVRSCASCHGEAGKGDGPVAKVLTKQPPDLTKINTRSDGKFPTTKIYQMIDGESVLGPHGSKQMPVWGDRYRVDAIEHLNLVPERPMMPETIAHGRILSLVYYLESIQK